MVRDAFAAISDDPASLDRDLAIFKFKTLFISDLHLGSGKTSTPYLYEFLKHLDFTKLDRIYLVGDVVGGWEHQSEKQKPLPEMERRVLDILNYAAASGIRIHYLPGNHDEKLRPLLPLLQARRSGRTFHGNIVFENESFYETGGEVSRKIKIVHGDQNDPGLFIKPWFRPVTVAVSTLYDGMVKANYHISNFCYERFGLHVSFAKHAKSAFKSLVNFFFSHKSLVAGLSGQNFDGMLMGHTHMAGVQAFKNQGRESILINDGDWVESCTAAYVDEDGALPKILNYKSQREHLGFGDLPHESDPHPAYFAALRPVTNRQVRLLQSLWPARNRDRLLKLHARAEDRLYENRAERAALSAVMAQLQVRQALDGEARDFLTRFINARSREAYSRQRRGLKGIFNRYAPGEELAEDDLSFAKTVIREFAARSERKIRKHERQLVETALKMDFRFPPAWGRAPVP